MEIVCQGLSLSQSWKMFSRAKPRRFWVPVVQGLLPDGSAVILDEPTRFEWICYYQQFARPHNLSLQKALTRYWKHQWTIQHPDLAGMLGTVRVLQIERIPQSL